MKTFIKVSILFFYVSSFSQIKLIDTKGIVLNSIDSTSLPYVNIYSDFYKIGTVTNELGEYLLSVPDTISNRIITFSSIGFLSKKINIENIKDTVFLSPSFEFLNEITISNKTPRFEQLVDSIYNRLKNNYSNKRHLLKTFYRQTTIKDSSYLRIIEADINIQQYGITKQLDRDRIKVNQYRRSDDKMSTRYKINWNLASKLFGEKNELVWLKKTDFINTFSKGKGYAYYHKNIVEEHKFNYEYSTSIDSARVYVFSFYNKRYENIPLSESQLSKIYINAKDFAVLKVEEILGYKKGNTFKNITKRIYHYSRIGDKYYLNSVFKSFFYNKTKELIIDNLYTYRVIVDRREYEKIGRLEREKIDEDFSNKAYKYDSIFWKNYKILPDVPLNIKMQSFIEKEKKLAKQYLNNSNGNQ